MSRHPVRPPGATYRVQVRPEFDFDAVAGLCDYLATLGISHVYLAPILQPVPGSQHGYDVVDHSRLNTELGGRPGFDRLCAALVAHGLSAIVDVVPNHMAVPTPERLNRALWSVLRDGPGSPFARWFDVDWSGGDQAVLMPVLGDRIGTVVSSGQIEVDRSRAEPVLRYADHEFPLRPGTFQLPLTEMLDRQWYRLAWWRVADDELNYRRFFDIDTLAGIRVEEPEVFEATHRVLLDLIAAGLLTGVRIDHPDGLADPRGYLRRLAAATDRIWVVVEKILAADETLPADWECAGTTGYDALQRITGLFVDPAAAAPLASLLTELTGEPIDFPAVADEAKREILERSLYAEVHRLTEQVVQICRLDLALRDHTRRHLQECLVELLVNLDRYRTYVVPGEPASAEAVQVIGAAAARARDRLPPDSHDTLDLVVDLLLGRPIVSLARRPEWEQQRGRLIVRFQQTCAAVMAKGVEDTAFYRWHRLTALNEVGGDPTRVGVPPEEFHAFADHLQRHLPGSMTTLSTHDTKRSEDVRARLAALTELTGEWAEAVRQWTEAAAGYRSPEGWPDPATEYLIWQVLVGTWSGGPLAEQRLLDYLAKATREAKRFTSWTDPNPGYDRAAAGFASAVLADPELTGSIGRWCEQLAGPARVAMLGQKLIQLVMPGVPDVYQGCEVVELALVDPDNRRPVDFPALRARLERLDSGRPPADLSDEKLLVTSRALRLRRELPGCFTGPSAGYAPVPTSTGNAVALARSDGTGPRVIAIATRLPVALARHGGWAGHTVALPDGFWVDRLTHREHVGGTAELGEILAELPVALLVNSPGR